MTDPTAALTSKGKSKIAFAYGTNYLIDTKVAIIVDVEASPARWTAEVAATRVMIERVKDRFELRPEMLAADTAYGSGGNLAWLMARGIEPHIPVLDRSSQTNGMFTRNDFAFDRERNLYLCPGGRELPLAGERRDNGILIYRVRGRDCSGCSLKPRCTTAAFRSLSVNAHEDTRQHVADLAKTEAFKTSAPLRRKIEMLFAHLKRNLNFRRLRLRGFTGARDECTLAATAQNLRKLVKLIGSSPPQTAGTPSPLRTTEAGAKEHSVPHAAINPTAGAASTADFFTGIFFFCIKRGRVVARMLMSDICSGVQEPESSP